MAELAPTEIKALAKLIDELDYYQLLHIEPGASASSVKAAYYATSRAFHPDANRHLDSELRAAVATIAKRITEAYAVLRDPRRRSAYDERLAKGEGVRMQLAEAQAAANRKASEDLLGKTPQGRQYANLALADLGKGDLEAAVRNLQLALAFEPDNASLKQKLEDTRKQLR